MPFKSVSAIPKYYGPSVAYNLNGFLIDSLQKAL